MTILQTILFLWVFYYFFVIVMGFYRLHLQKKLKGPIFIVALPAIIVGFVMDVICQFTVATAVFREFPAKKEYLVTDRLQRYMLQPNNWRYKLAKYICENFLDPIDPTGKHC